MLSPVGGLGYLSIDQSAQSGLSSFYVIYYFAKLFSMSVLNKMVSGWLWNCEKYNQDVQAFNYYGLY
ncbi:hypothetical protein RG31_18305 [Escherichia coli]|nr:hypothetical protein RG31_18305 [Escherichia coli]